MEFILSTFNDLQIIKYEIFFLPDIINCNTFLM